jgi:enoyl-CoA hydratase/carnithine racemase
MSLILDYEVVGEGVLLLTMNRPEYHHALNFELAAELVGALDKAEKDQTIRAVVLTGSGDKSFCAGQDMVEESRRTKDDEHKVSAYLAIDKFSESHLPLLAAVNGYCYGGGAALAIACDIRLASESATFRLPGAEYGLVVGAASNGKCDSLNLSIAK